MKSFQQLRRRLRRVRRSSISRPSAMDANRTAIQEALGRPLQTKLKLGAPDDAREREADAVAERVMRMPAGTQAKVGEDSSGWEILRQCSDCREKDEEQVRRQTQEDEEQEELQTKPAASGAKEGGSVTADTAARIQARRGGGMPLPAAERAFFEPRLGSDLGRVRLHTDQETGQLSQGLAARAFTVGRDIFFGRDQFRPDTVGGRILLAHELAHVLQQDARRTLRRQTVTPESELAAPLRTGLLRASGFRDWHYVAYLDDDTILLGRNIKSGNATRRIGSIPWITRNPGNITVSTKPEREVGPAAKEAFKQGAYAKGAGQTDAATRRYAVFPTRFLGLQAIWHQLQVTNKSNGGNLKLIDAMKIFKGVEANESQDVKERYVKAIEKRMADEIKNEHAAERQLSEAEALAEARRILARRVSDIKIDEVEYHIARDALVVKEGGLVAPGITYSCSDGFADNDKDAYTRKQWKVMEALKSSEAVRIELRALLGCE